jgi:putative glutathione S-transferase
MGILIDGVWREDGDYGRKDEVGRFIRMDSIFRNWVTPDGRPGPTGKGGFKAEPGRYHLYVALACPWAHRTVIYRSLKRLDGAITMSIVEPLHRNNGWEFSGSGIAHTSGATPDDLHGAQYMYEVYTRADPGYSGRVTVPVLWDKHNETIVNNESSEIIRMLNSAFDEGTDRGADFYPSGLRGEIDRLNAVIYDNVNNGVYKCGFASSQKAYEEAFDILFRTLDEIEERLARNRYLLGGRITEADWRLFPTLVRFDAAYYGAFKCNLRRIADYPNLWNYTRELYQVPGVAATVDIEHIKRSYYSIARINLNRIIPKGPEIDLSAIHDRARIVPA